MVIKGYLLKKSKYTQQWNKVWVVLRHHQLSYYKDENECRALKVIGICDIRGVDEAQGLSLGETLNKGQDKDKLPGKLPGKDKFTVYTNNRILEFKTAKGESGAWTTALSNLLQPWQITFDQSKFDTNKEYLVETGDVLVKAKKVYIVLTNKNMYFLKERGLVPYKVMRNRELVDVVELGRGLLVVTKEGRMRLGVDDMGKWVSAIVVARMLAQTLGPGTLGPKGSVFY